MGAIAFEHARARSSAQQKVDHGTSESISVREGGAPNRGARVAGHIDGPPSRPGRAAANEVERIAGDHQGSADREGRSRATGGAGSLRLVKRDAADFRCSPHRIESAFCSPPRALRSRSEEQSPCNSLHFAPRARLAADVERARRSVHSLVTRNQSETCPGICIASAGSRSNRNGDRHRSCLGREQRDPP